MPGARWTRYGWLAPATLLAAVVYLSLHLPFLAWAPDDIDATNFMLALHDFDLREHQPHPPGYPVFIAMGRTARAVMAAIGPFTGPSSAETLDVNALASVSAVFGALAAIPLVALWTVLGGSRSRAWLAAVLAMCSPLFWYTGIRPLSDLPGLAVAVMSLAFLVREIVTPREPHGWRMLAGPVLAGIAAGVRMQTLWLTSPALGAALGVMLWRRDLRATTAIAAGFVGGILAWAIPLMIAVGGWRTYVDVLTAQAADDFRGAILAVDFSPRTLAFALYDSFVLPWGGVAIAAIVLALAIVGLVRIAWTQTRETLVLAFVFVPYMTLHLLFHETSHTRYALPLVLPVAYLAVCGIHPVIRARWVAALALIVVAAWTSMGPVAAQARVGSPAVRALSDVREALKKDGNTHPVIAMHHAVRQQLRFADLDEPLLPGPLRYEWLAVVDHFRSGGDRPVWFLASRRRSDLVLFDPAAKRAINEYRWAFAPEAVLGGARPRAVTWYEIRRPGWMAGEGWALTPETRGVAERSHRSPGAGATVAYIARRPEQAVIMIGGRNLGGPCRTAARLEMLLDGRTLAEWQLSAGEPFLQFLDLPAGALDGPRGFAELRLVASDLSGGGLGVDVSLEQFDVQSGRRPLAGFAVGWHEPELEPATGERWRWASQRAVLQIQNFGRDVVLGLKADDPTVTLGRAMELQVRSAGRVLARRRFDTRVDWTVKIPKEILEQARGRVTLISDASFVPDKTTGNGDHRELALRVFEVDVEFDAKTGNGGS